MTTATAPWEVLAEAAGHSNEDLVRMATPLLIVYAWHGKVHGNPDEGTALTMSTRQGKAQEERSNSNYD